MKTINLSSIHPNPWFRQFPNSVPEWEGWKFIFNAENEAYDYLVVFDDLHAAIKPKCPKDNIIHLATEPPSVHHYDDHFLQQFAWRITQDKTLQGSGKICHQPGLTWFIGWCPGETDHRKVMDFWELKKLVDEPKSKLISVIASNKAFTPEHKARLDFALKLKKHYGDRIDFYGRGFASMDDKLVSLKEYRFQVVLENSFHDHYFSEKLTDCILAGTYPIYYGCPNLDQYYPENSYFRINIENFDESIAAIDQAIQQSVDEKYRIELLKARDHTLYQHNLFPMLIKIIGQIENGDFGDPHGSTFYCDELLPFGDERFKDIFDSKASVTLRAQLSNLANTSSFFGFLRNIYRAARGR